MFNRPALIRLLLFIFIFFSHAPLKAQQVEKIIQTKAQNSPAVWAEEVVITYGISVDVISELIRVFEDSGTTGTNLKEKTKDLLSNFRNLSPKDKVNGHLSEDAITELGLGSDSRVCEVLNWVVYTEGSNSPGIIALGNAEVWYGLPPSTFKELTDFLIQQKISVENFEEELKKLIAQVHVLESELYGKSDEWSLKAKELLQNGQLYEARQVLKMKYEGRTALRKSVQKSEANDAFEYALALELTYEYVEAYSIISEAVALDSTNVRLLIKKFELANLTGKFDEAIKILEKLRDIDYEKKDAVVLLEGIASSLGSTFVETSNFPKAKYYLFDFLDFDTSYLIKSEPEVAIALFNNRGYYFLKTEQNENAAYYLNRAISIAEQQSGLEHPYLGTFYNNFAETLINSKKYNAAIALYKKAYTLDSARYGLNHPYLITRTANLANALLKIHKYQESKDLLTKSISQVHSTFGSSHFSLTYYYGNLADLFKRLEDFENAEKCYLKSIDIGVENFGKAHFTVANNYHDLGKLYEYFDQCDNAATAFEQAEAIYLDIYGPEHTKLQVLRASAYNLAMRIIEEGFESFKTGNYDQARISCRLTYRLAKISVDTLLMQSALLNLIDGYYFSNRRCDSLILTSEKYIDLIRATSPEKYLNKTLEATVAKENQNLALLPPYFFYDKQIIYSLARKCHCLKSEQRIDEYQILFKQLRAYGTELKDQKLLKSLELISEN